MSPQFQIFWQLISGQRWRYGLALGCLMAATLLAYCVPLIGTATIDYAIAGKPVDSDTPRLVRFVLSVVGGAENLRGALWLAPVAMLLLSMTAGLFGYLKGWQVSLASDGIARDLKNRLYDHLGHLPASYHDRADTGDLVQRCTSDVETTRQFLAGQLMEIGNALVLAGVALPLLYSLSPSMTGVSFALILPLVLYGYLYFRRVKHVFLEVAEAEGALTALIQGNLTGIRVVRAFGRQDFECAKFAGPNARFRDRNLRLMRLLSWYWSVSDFVALSQVGLTLMMGAHWITTGEITVGVLFAFLAYLSILLWPVRQMGRVLTDLGKATIAVGRIREVLAVERERDTAAAAVAPTPSAALRGAIAVRGLRFTHGGELAALNDISFDVAPGETLAILGPSGAGKSTLMHLLLRLYDYTAGEILIDGVELRSLPRKWIRSQIGVVMQEPFLFSRTLKENLRFGRVDAPDHEIEEAARAACIHDTILTFAEGYNTVIGERGITLSGGQRQRVAIARAVLKRPPLLILDDALSAVDGETENVILDALRQRRGQATTLVIAHRLSTLTEADRIIVLDGGRIIQTGTHTDLIRQPGFYRRLWEIQTSVESEFALDATR